MQTQLGITSKSCSHICNCGLLALNVHKVCQTTTKLTCFVAWHFKFQFSDVILDMCTCVVLVHLRLSLNAHYLVNGLKYVKWICFFVQVNDYLVLPLDQSIDMAKLVLDRQIEYVMSCHVMSCQWNTNTSNCVVYYWPRHFCIENSVTFMYMMLSEM